MTKKKIKIEVIGAEGKMVGEEDFVVSAADKASLALVAQVIKAYLANQRRARAKAKTRAQVIGSKSKIYRQKGTGRARHGDRQAPIFVGGGVAHGPTGEQNYHQGLNRKMNQKAFLTVLANKAQEKKLQIVTDLNFKKTKEAFLFFQKLKADRKIAKDYALVLGKAEEVARALRNLAEITLLKADCLNAYELLRQEKVFLTKKAWQELQARLGLEEKG